MSIAKFSNGLDRRHVGFLGSIPTKSDAAFYHRGYKCVALDSTQPPDQSVLWGLDCLILIQDNDIETPNKLSRELETFAPLLLPRDGRIYILPTFDIDSNRMARLKWLVISAIHAHEIPNSGLEEGRERFVEWDERPELPAFGPFAHIINKRPPYDWVEYDWVKIANIIRSNPASTAPQETLPNISANESNDDKIDLDNVHLIAVSNGLSGIGTYKAYVKLCANPVGQSRPYVYFVKLGKRKTIATEYRKYEANNAMDHVPYHLGPRLRRDRCALGHKWGVIVTDYVHTAEPLRDCARDGRAGAAIGNLFSHTLRNWRDSAKVEKDYDIREHLRKIIEKEVPVRRNETINTFNTTKSHEELRELLLISESKPTLMGVIHNDLHATNVLVRANDAIIIDFEKLEESGPLLYDVASLEAGLFADGFVGDKRDPLELLKSIDSLYTLEALDWKFPEFNSSDRSAWFFECVRLVRMHARDMQIPNHQYALVLAAVLLKKSCNENDFDELDKVDKTANLITREQTRALAYVLAEKIILSLSKSTSAKEAK
jgi:hypothetical protein